MTPLNEDAGRKRSPADFFFGKVIGEGSFSTVYLAKDVHTSREFAIKVLEKAHIIREKKTEYVMREKEVLRILGSSCSYFVHLYSTFQDRERLYFVLTYAKNGELLKHINHHKKFNFECTRYYAAELVLALEYLRSKGIVHRDLKPENILFDENFHLLVTDFGSAKIERSEEAGDDEKSLQRRRSFVGTAQFVSPEMLKDSTSSYPSDLWALGCIVFQMAAGEMPFTGPTDYLIFAKVENLDYVFPDGFDERVKDFVEKLLVLEPNRRLGALDAVPYTSLREHQIFAGLDWDDLGPPPKLSDASYIIEEPGGAVPDHMEPGLDSEKVSKLVLTDMIPALKKSEPGRKITDLSPEEIEKRLLLQATNAYNDFVGGHLILKQGLLDKRKGLFPRRRMFLLTLGPHLYYVDPVTMTLKGEIPWSEDLKTEARNFKTFFVHTPKRKYYLEDPEGYAPEWCKAIEQVKEHYFPPGQKLA
ncbi:3-phosphoinositide-dependent protein kinase 1 isoform X2 [Cylas formicarius]|uniref:3-phosphoinositide-dependent protein kinase 1 isoform X2 n=1 Tax=Cylas formicarius TaxID=197179 RepID=UPI002958A6EF|nr:3-phosphoinositide-dependent protein kinase 1 isoform X2 [Cylas formicarius]